jgi:hypothetical protein
MALPDFLIAGAPKAGTTALHTALAAHPGLFMSAVKEPKFFLSGGPPQRRGGGPGDAQTYREHIWRGRTTRRCSPPRRPARCAASPPRSTSMTGTRSGGSGR